MIVNSRGSEQAHARREMATSATSRRNSVSQRLVLQDSWRFSPGIDVASPVFVWRRHVMGVKAPIAWLAVAGLALASSGTAVSAQRSERLRRQMDGEEIYRAYCSTCHGVDGRGQGPTAAALSTPPADLTLIALRNGGAFPHDRIVRFVTYGDPSRPVHG